MEKTWVNRFAVWQAQVPVNFHRQRKALGVVLAQPLPVLVGTKRTKDTTRTRHRQWKLAVISQPMAAMPQCHFVRDEWEYRLDPGIFRQPLPDQFRPAAFVISDRQI